MQTYSLQKRLLVLITGASVVAFAALTPAMAADAAAKPEQKPRWESTAGIGATIQSGNSESVLVTINALTQRKWEKNELRFGLDGGYGKAKPVGSDSMQKNTDYIRGFGQYNRLFSERLYGYFKADFLHDDIADIMYRVTLSPGAGYYFIKETSMTLSAEIGPGYVFEKLGDQEDSYATMRIAERYDWKFSKSARLWEMVEYLPQIDDWVNSYLVNAEIGVEADLTNKLAMRVYAQDTYRSRPAPGRKNNDVRLVAALNYKF